MPSAGASPRLEAKPLPDDFVSAQPGGGRCYALELAWGGLRRWWLKRFWPGYVGRMAERMQGSAEGAPHEILDPRDLKYCRNRCTADWLPADDLFRWRERIPVARWGLAELQVMGWPILVAVVVLALATWYAAVVPAAILLWLVWFFRDPPRRVPEEPGLVVSPADGRIAEITELAHDPFIDGPAVRIGIFLSIFNVHINRSPVAARVIELRYRRGEFLNALRAESAERNENTWIALEEAQPPYRRYVVRQIAGAIARRIVCALRPDEVVQRGAKFGMIKFGSRTELILPAGPGLTIACRKGQAVHAGTSVLARWEEPGGGNSDQAVEG